jgi:hypothetical protein
MKILVVVLLVCLLITGAVSAKAAGTSISDSIVNPAASSGIYTLAAHIACSDDSASVGTDAGMGDLDVDSIPDGASITLDGSPWSTKHCIGGFPPTCFTLPVFTPYTGAVATGTHSVTIALDGYKSYTGTVDICSQKVSYVHKTLTLIPTTTTTTPTTTVSTTTTTAATTTVTTSTTTAAVTGTTAASTTSSGSTTTAAVPAVTASAAGTAVQPGTGSLTVSTTPAGAAVFIDGVQRGVSPAVIPGLAAGSHTVVLRLDGYQELSAPVPITAGTMNDFSTGLTPLSAGTAPVTAAAGAPPAATKAQSPGFEASFGLAALGFILYLRNGSSR